MEKELHVCACVKQHKTGDENMPWWYSKHEKISTTYLLVCIQVLIASNAPTHQSLRYNARGVMINSNINIRPPLVKPAKSIHWPGLA